jgi:hypothetical protein
MKSWISLSTVLMVVGFGLLWTQPVMAQDGTSNVELEVFTCPAGTFAGTDPARLAELCLEPADPVSITVGDGSTWAEGDDTTGEAPQTVGFEGIAAGPLQIVEAVPDGMGEPRVVCFNAGFGDYVTIETYEIPSDTFTFRAFVRIVEPGATLMCRIFHIPTEEEVASDPAAEAGIHFSFHACPAGTSLAGSVEALSGECREGLTSVSVMAQRPGWMSFTGTAGTPGTPMELWLDEVRPGDVHLELAADEELVAGALFCGEPDTEPEVIPVDGDGVASLTYEAETVVLCEVFMAPPAMATPIASPVASPIT